MEEWRKNLFNFEEALLRLKITQQEVDEFKVKATSCEEIPMGIAPELVIYLVHVKN